MKANSEEKKAERLPLKKQLKREMAQWQTKMDETKWKSYLSDKEVQDQIKPYLEIFEQELTQAEKQWKVFKTASENACLDIHKGLKASFHVMQNSFENAQKYLK